MLKCTQKHACAHTSHLADALLQSDLQEQLGLSALLKGTLKDVFPCQFRGSNQQPFATGPTRLTARLPAVSLLALVFVTLFLHSSAA